MKRNKFSLSHYKLLTGNMGELIPISWFDVLPGDSVQMNSNCLIRCAQLLAPIMHPVRARINHWYVPYRLIWEDFEDFITGGPDGTSAPVLPHHDFTGTVAEGSLADYLGIPAENYTTYNLGLNVLPFRAYNAIWNEHYRDQDLATLRVNSTASGTDTTTDITTASVAWEKDYFTTSRPWESKGDEVHVPVLGIGKATGVFVAGSLSNRESSGKTRNYDFYQEIDPAAADTSFYVDGTAASSGWPDIHVNINDLRLAQGLHRYQEARAQYGSRYVEYLKYLGVRPSDGRLQNPEYLGGGRQVIQFSEVLSTDGANTGDMKGHGISAIRTNKFRRFFEEHGIVMTMLSLVPKHIQMQSMQKAWIKTTKEDFFQRELQHIGEEEVYNSEVWNPHATGYGTFGYQKRYEEYKSIPSTVSGEFRSSLNYWHMARDLGAAPTLNESYITCTPTTRVYAAPSADQIYVMANHSVQARRMMDVNP